MLFQQYFKGLEDIQSALDSDSFCEHSEDAKIYLYYLELNLPMYHPLLTIRDVFTRVSVGYIDDADFYVDDIFGRR